MSSSATAASRTKAGLPRRRKASHATVWATALVIAVVAGLYTMERASIPPHLSNHAVRLVPELIQNQTAVELLELIKQFGEFTSNVDQSKAQGFRPKYEDIGAFQDINPDGTCEHKFLFPNPPKDRCVLPQRVDIGKHFIMTGGVDGAKELYKDLVDRVSSFGRYTFIEDIDKYPPVKTLFDSAKFQNAAKSVCPADKQFLDPFQFNFIIQVPGQTVALHIDSPYFWGADRFSFPQWFLVAMVFSNLFREKFVDQVQVVGYLHSWDPNDLKPESPTATRGEFVWYNNASSWEAVLPSPLSGSVVDGSKMLHASTIYRPKTKAPRMDKGKDNVLKWLGGDRWEVQSDGQTIQKYSTQDLRITIVYRARCFKDAEELDAYKAYGTIMDLDDILSKMVDDLVGRGALKESEKASINRLDLAFKIIETYIRYPLPPLSVARIPYNYCAIPVMFPVLEKLFALIC